MGASDVYSWRETVEQATDNYGADQELQPCHSSSWLIAALSTILRMRTPYPSALVSAVC